MVTVIPVEMGETRVSNRRTDNLRAIGLGACIGICLYDPISSIAAMVHVVLPRTPALPPATPTKRPLPQLPGKCADTAIPYVLTTMEHAGAVLTRVQAAIVGGAQIFTAPSANGAPSPISRLEIGPRNVEAVRAGLARVGVPLVAEQIGGHCGRTVTFEVMTGKVMVRAIGAEERMLVCLAETFVGQRRKEGLVRG